MEMEMFHIGDIIVYSVHGLSRIDDICEKTYFDETKLYYVLHPLDNTTLTISTPVDNEKVLMLKMMNREQSKEILQSFKQPGTDWIEEPRQRVRKYKETVHTGDRKEIAKIVNTMLRKSVELKQKEKKLYDQDQKILDSIKKILFKELAMSLDTDAQEIAEQVNRMIVRYH